MSKYPPPLTLAALEKPATSHQLNICVPDGGDQHGSRPTHYIQAIDKRIAHAKDSNLRVSWNTTVRRYGYSEDSDVEEESEFTHCLRQGQASEVAPSIALRRVMLLFDNLQFTEAAAFISRLNYASFKGMLKELPIEKFIEAIPQSLTVLEVLYSKVFINSQDGLNVSVKSLRPESTVWHLVKLFAMHNPLDNGANCLLPCLQERLDAQHPFVVSTKRVLKVILLTEPRVKKQLEAKKKGLDKAIEGLGHHGLVGTGPDDRLLNLHDALKSEMLSVIQLFKNSVQKLEELASQSAARSVSKGPAPCKSSHQRQLSVRHGEIQERLIKNKTLLNAVEPCIPNRSLQLLFALLQQRIEMDKEAVFQFTQLQKVSPLRFQGSPNVRDTL